MTVNQGRVKGNYQLDIPLAYLNPLVTGYNDIRRLDKNPYAKLKGEERSIRLIEVLFPRRYPFGGRPPLVWK